MMASAPTSKWQPSKPNPCHALCFHALQWPSYCMMCIYSALGSPDSRELFDVPCPTSRKQPRVPPTFEEKRTHVNKNLLARGQETNRNDFVYFTCFPKYPRPFGVAVHPLQFRGEPAADLSPPPVLNCILSPISTRSKSFRNPSSASRIHSPMPSHLKARAAASSVHDPLIPPNPRSSDPLSPSTAKAQPRKR